MVVRYTQDSSILVKTFQNPPPSKVCKTPILPRGSTEGSPDRRTDGHRDQLTNGWAHPLIEMLGILKKMGKQNLFLRENHEVISKFML